MNKVTAQALSNLSMITPFSDDVKGIESPRHFLMIYSFSDFILRRSVLHQLRHCEPQPGMLWGGLVMTTGDVTRAARVSQQG